MFCTLTKLIDALQRWNDEGRNVHVETPYLEFGENDEPLIAFDFYETLAGGSFIATYPSEVIYEPYNRETLRDTKWLFPDFNGDYRTYRVN